MEIGPKTPNKATNPQKVTQSGKLHVSHQMKLCSSVKAIWESIYTCLSIFVELEQVNQIGHNYPKLWAQKKSSKVLDSTFHIK